MELLTALRPDVLHDLDEDLSYGFDLSITEETLWNFAQICEPSNEIFDFYSEYDRVVETHHNKIKADFEKAKKKSPEDHQQFIGKDIDEVVDDVFDAYVRADAPHLAFEYQERVRNWQMNIAYPDWVETDEGNLKMRKEDKPWRFLKNKQPDEVEQGLMFKFFTEWEKHDILKNLANCSYFSSSATPVNTPPKSTEGPVNPWTWMYWWLTGNIDGIKWLELLEKDPTSLVGMWENKKRGKKGGELEVGFEPECRVRAKYGTTYHFLPGKLIDVTNEGDTNNCKVIFDGEDSSTVVRKRDIFKIQKTDIMPSWYTKHMVDISSELKTKLSRFICRQDYRTLSSVEYLGMLMMYAFREEIHRQCQMRMYDQWLDLRNWFHRHGNRSIVISYDHMFDDNFYHTETTEQFVQRMYKWHTDKDLLKIATDDIQNRVRNARINLRKFETSAMIYDALFTKRDLDLNKNEVFKLIDNVISNFRGYNLIPTPAKNFEFPYVWEPLEKELITVDLQKILEEGGKYEVKALHRIPSGESYKDTCELATITKMHKIDRFVGTDTSDIFLLESPAVRFSGLPPYKDIQIGESRAISRAQHGEYTYDVEYTNSKDKAYDLHESMLAPRDYEFSYKKLTEKNEEDIKTTFVRKICDFISDDKTHNETKEVRDLILRKYGDGEGEICKWVEESYKVMLDEKKFSWTQYDTYFHGLNEKTDISVLKSLLKANENKIKKYHENNMFNFLNEEDKYDEIKEVRDLVFKKYHNGEIGLRTWVEKVYNIMLKKKAFTWWAYEIYFNRLSDDEKSYISQLRELLKMNEFIDEEDEKKKKKNETPNKKKEEDGRKRGVSKGEDFFTYCNNWLYVMQANNRDMLPILSSNTPSQVYIDKNAKQKEKEMNKRLTEMIKIGVNFARHFGNQIPTPTDAAARLRDSLVKDLKTFSGSYTFDTLVEHYNMEEHQSKFTAPEAAWLLSLFPKSPMDVNKRLADNERVFLHVYREQITFEQCEWLKYDFVNFCSSGNLKTSDLSSPADYPLQENILAVMHRSADDHNYHLVKHLKFTLAEAVWLSLHVDDSVEYNGKETESFDKMYDKVEAHCRYEYGQIKDQKERETYQKHLHSCRTPGQMLRSGQKLSMPSTQYPYHMRPLFPRVKLESSISVRLKNSTEVTDAAKLKGAIPSPYAAFLQLMYQAEVALVDRKEPKEDDYAVLYPTRRPWTASRGLAIRALLVGKCKEKWPVQWYDLRDKVPVHVWMEIPSCVSSMYYFQHFNGMSRKKKTVRTLKKKQSPHKTPRRPVSPERALKWPTFKTLTVPETKYGEFGGLDNGGVRCWFNSLCQFIFRGTFGKLVMGNVKKLILLFRKVLQEPLNSKRKDIMKIAHACSVAAKSDSKYVRMKCLQGYEMWVWFVTWKERGNTRVTKWKIRDLLKSLLEDKTFLTYVCMELMYDSYVQINTTTSRSINVHELQRVLSYLHEIFNDCEQEDSTEGFYELHKILEVLQEKDENKSFMLPEVLDPFRNMVSYKTQRVKCGVCNNENITVKEPFYLMPINLASLFTSVTLSNYLKSVSLGEVLEKYYCGRCHKNVDSAESLDTWEYGDFICFHGESNLYDVSMARGVKSKNSMNLIIEDEIDVNEQKYVLVALVKHHGLTTRSGHYIAFIKLQGQWYKYNDSSVTASTYEEATRQKVSNSTAETALMILYERVEKGAKVEEKKEGGSADEEEGDEEDGGNPEDEKEDVGGHDGETDVEEGEDGIAEGTEEGGDIEEHDEETGIEKGEDGIEDEGEEDGDAEKHDDVEEEKEEGKIREEANMHKGSMSVDMKKEISDSRVRPVQQEYIELPWQNLETWNAKLKMLPENYMNEEVVKQWINSHETLKQYYSSISNNHRNASQLQQIISRILRDTRFMKIYAGKLPFRPIPLQSKNSKSEHKISNAEIRMLMECAFLGFLGDDVSLTSILNNVPLRAYHKLLCILNYFNIQFYEPGPDRLISFKRTNKKFDVNLWKTSNAVVHKVTVHNLRQKNGKIEKVCIEDVCDDLDDKGGCWEVDFANKHVGGGVFDDGAVQEEIRFMQCPELLICRLFMDVLGDDECVHITGYKQFNDTQGYGSRVYGKRTEADLFQWKSNHTESTRKEERRMIVMDAIRYAYEEEWVQFSMKNINRELHKAYVAFDTGDDRPISTGHWGCGAFNGNKKLKAVIQIMAAGMAGKELHYCLFDDNAAEVREFIDSIKSGTSIRKLYATIEKEIGEARGVENYFDKHLNRRSLFKALSAVGQSQTPIIEPKADRKRGAREEITPPVAVDVFRGVVPPPPRIAAVARKGGTNWFYRTFGFYEEITPSATDEDKEKDFDKNKAKFKLQKDMLDIYLRWTSNEQSHKKFVGRFETPTLDTLTQQFKQLEYMKTKPVKVDKHHVVMGHDKISKKDQNEEKDNLIFEHMFNSNVRDLILFPDNKNAVFMVASQFNALEMIDPKKTPQDGITIYEKDRTQGPVCAMACPYATVYRNYFHEKITLLRTVSRLLNNRNAAYYEIQNGYMFPYSKDSYLKMETDIQQKMEDNEDYEQEIQNNLRVGVHWSTDVVNGDHRVTQVFCSALPISKWDDDIKSCTQENHRLALAVLKGAYKATLAVAALRAAELGTNVKVFLTALGGGAFENDPEWIRKAINRALYQYRRAPLEVYLVHFQKEEYVVHELRSIDTGTLSRRIAVQVKRKYNTTEEADFVKKYPSTILNVKCSMCNQKRSLEMKYTCHKSNPSVYICRTCLDSP
jgi:ubiquitin C-terminal hydrolase